MSELDDLEDLAFGGQVDNASPARVRFNALPGNVKKRFCMHVAPDGITCRERRLHGRTYCREHHAPREAE